MKLLLLIFVCLSSVVNSASNMTCDKDDPQVQEIIYDLAKKDLKTFIQKVAKREFTFDLDNNSFEFFTEPYNDYANINHSHDSLGGTSIIDSFIIAHFKTKAGHHLSFKSWYTVWSHRGGNQLPEDFHGIPYTYEVEKKMMTSGSYDKKKGICIIRPVFNFKLNYRISHVDLDKWVAFKDMNNEHPIFTTWYRFNLLP